MLYDSLCTSDNLEPALQKARLGKTKKQYVQKFEERLAYLCECHRLKLREILSQYKIKMILLPYMLRAVDLFKDAAQEVYPT